MKPSMGIFPLGGTLKLLEMLDRNWKLRIKAVREQMMFRMAEQAKKSILAKLGPVRDEKEYKDSLQVAAVTGLKSGEASYAVAILGNRKPVKLDPERTLVVITPTRRMKRDAPGILALIKNSPWTIPTIPFIPNKGDATVTYRKASRKMVLATEKTIEKNKRFWTRDLVRSGYKPDAQKTKMSKKGIAGYDTSLIGASMEWGVGGAKATPHWRPAIQALKSNSIKSMMKDRNLIRAATDPDFKDWMRWPTKTKKKISVRVAQSFVPFQKKLGFK